MLKPPTIVKRFSKYYIYRNEQRYYILCIERTKTKCKVIELDRCSLTLEITSLPEEFSLEEGLRKIAQALAERDHHLTKEKHSVILSKFFVVKTYGIIGFPRFLDGHYLYLIIKRELVATIFGSEVYRVTEAKLENILSQEMSCLFRMTSTKNSEIRYIEYFNYMDFSFFYFSYELDLSNNFQALFSSHKTFLPKEPDESFIWNVHILQPLSGKDLAQEVLLPVIYGYIEFKDIKIGATEFQLGIISRRSRFNVGTRFLRRGLNDEGFVANHVETELVLIEYLPSTFFIKNICAFAFVRGSIPAFWGHEKTKISPKPPIFINADKDPQFLLSELHFNRLFDKYGEQICIINLLKKSQKSSEQKLGELFQSIFDGLAQRFKGQNTKHSMRWQWLDFFSFYHKSEKMLINFVQKFGRESLKWLSMFHLSSFTEKSSFQKGVIRVNCIDCLDRTNNVIAIISSVVLAKMFKLCGARAGEIIDSVTRAVRNEMLSCLFEMFGVS